MLIRELKSLILNVKKFEPKFTVFFFFFVSSFLVGGCGNWSSNFNRSLLYQVINTAK